MRKIDYLQDFFEFSPIGFHIFGPDRKFVAINQAELNMIGYQREEIVGKKTWVDLIVPEQKSVFEKHWENLITTGLAINIEYTMVHKKGHQVDVILNASARKAQTGKIINTRGSVIDISQRKKFEIEALNSKNIALKEILGSLEIEKNQIKKDVVSNVDELVLPLIAKLKRKSSASDRRIVDLIETALKDIISPFAGIISNKKWKLSPKEIEVCHMIQKGLRTKEISQVLNTSCRTVENHRNHIRRKLGISRKEVNLAAYLLYTQNG